MMTNAGSDDVENMLSTIATIGRWSSLCSGLFTLISAITICPLLYTFNHHSNITYFCWLIVASSYLLVTICHKYVVKFTKNLTEEFYAELSVVCALMYACYECAVYYLQLTFVHRGAAPSMIQDEPGTPIFAVDIFGYFWLSVSTIFLARSFFEEGKSNNAATATKTKFLQYLLYVHGIAGSSCIVVPALPIMYKKNAEGGDDVMWQYVLLVWCAQFIPICFLLSKNFGSYNQEKHKRWVR